MATPLYDITTTGKGFQWGNNRNKFFEELKQKINKELLLTLPNLYNPFELEIDANGYAMGVILMQGGRSTC